MRFPIGRLVITANANNVLDEKDWVQALARHVNGDWGDICEEDEGLNDEALVCGARIFSVYKNASGRKFWIITEHDRSYTTILLPEDY